MNFVHMPYQPGETIAAIATPPGEGGVAIIRISGREAVSVADKIFSGSIASYKTHTVHFGKVHTLAGEHVDDALVLVMLGKRSYTGEDTVEIHCHGGSVITRKVLECALSAGARPARAGEFTFKAFINGKIDLAQAEAVQELISAKNEIACKTATDQLQGALTQKINSFQKELTEIAAILEAWVDFPEEGLAFATLDEICGMLDKVTRQVEELSNTFYEGKIVATGVDMCLVGCPNVGKSSLMNALLEKERAIVTHIAGTTRDLVEDHLHLGGLHFRLIDTAGIREGKEIVEIEGIKRSMAAMKTADLILLVLDASGGLREEDKKLLAMARPEKTIAVWNKIDLPHDEIPFLGLPHVVHICAKEGRGLLELKKAIEKVVWSNGAPDKNEIVITKLRHKEALATAALSARRVIAGLQEGVSPEFVTIDMRDSLTHLGNVIGQNISEEILSAIFSKFCIGK